MGTPRKSEIMEKAVELFMKEQWQNGTKSSITPTEAELKEGHYFEIARQTLMQSNPHCVVIEKEEEPKRDLAKNDFEVDVAEALKSGVFCCGTTGSGKSDLGMYVANIIRGHDVIVIVFDPSQDWQARSSIPQYTQTRRAYVPQQSTIFDLSMHSVKQSQEFIERFCKMLMEQQAISNEKRYFLIFEEGQVAFPEGILRAKAYQNTSKMMTVGRNFGIRFMCITPFSSLIDKKAMRYMKQRYFGYTDEPNDIKYLEGFLSEQAEQLKTLSAGQFLYYHKGAVQPISIEPFKRKTAPKKLDSPQIFTELEETPHTIQNTQYVLTKLAIASLWFVAIIAAILTKP